MVDNSVTTQMTNIPAPYVIVGKQLRKTHDGAKRDQDVQKTASNVMKTILFKK